VATGGYGLDGQWNDDVRHALHVTLTGESDRFHAQYDGLPDLVTALREIFILTGRYSAYRGRRHGRPAGDLPANRFVGFLQNHDHVGNRALGERSSGLVSADALAVAAAIVLLGPFVPLLFQGEEWGASTPFRFFAEFGDQALGEAVRTGRRREFAAFGWKPEDVPDPLARGTFEASRLDRDEVHREPHASLLEWHRRLIRLRAATQGSSGARPALQADLEQGWLVAVIGGRTLAANVSRSSQQVPVGPGHELALASDPGIALDGGRLLLPATSVALLTRSASACEHRSSVACVTPRPMPDGGNA
jgi:maltooligosyltrehalose trehalohydrolase